MSDNTCIFCKIVNGEIPSRTIYEDDDLKAFLDVNPATKGHVLIIPKEHSRDLHDLPDATAEKVIKLAKRIAAKLKEELGCDGINILQNNGQTAGQTVFHYHLHIIPRYEDDKNDDILRWNVTKVSDEEMGHLVSKLKL